MVSRAEKINSYAYKAVLISLLTLTAIVFSVVYSYSGTSAAIKSVDPEIVCMVTDKVLGKPQIPIEVGGKTYYGCCKGCVAALNGDKAVRYGSDPVSGKPVDKSEAFILEGPSGEALYFESAATAEVYLDSRGKVQR
ncbi:MAG: hypothetical protein BMS9Abin23_0853 [Thermodesulfobacteriota bacterium]|nr:MAG: hypothetical protein BMS9Abin23_0853 [Thermodesulfobacteriota bacterium]